LLHYSNKQFFKQSRETYPIQTNNSLNNLITDGIKWNVLGDVACYLMTSYQAFCPLTDNIIEETCYHFFLNKNRHWTKRRKRLFSL